MKPNGGSNSGFGGRPAGNRTINSISEPKDPFVETIGNNQRRGESNKQLYWGIMAFFLFAYLRPQDVLTPLQKFHPDIIIISFLTIGYATSSKASSKIDVPLLIKGLLFFNAVMFLSIPFSYHHGNSLDGAVRFLITIVLVCFLITMVLDSFDRIERLFKMLNFGIIVLAVHIAKQYLGGASHGSVHGLVGAQFRNPNDLGVNFVLFLPMVYYYFLKGKDTFSKLLSLALFGIILFGVLATQSRGAMLGASVVLVLLMIKTERKGLALVSGAVALVVVLTFAPDNALKRFGTVFSFLSGSGDEKSEEYGNAETRTWFYESSIQMMLARPLTGVGMGAWSRAYGLEFRNPKDESNRWPDAHSSYFMIIGELGVPGIVAYLYLIYITLSTIKSLERRFKSGPLYWRELYFIQCMRIGFYGFLVSTIFQTFAYYPTVYNMMAVVYAMDRIYRKDANSPAAPIVRKNGK